MHIRNFLIGIDDTDNLESRGTGFRVRQLGKLLAENSIAQVFGITRHQLFVSPLIPYTSHNSSACMAVAIDPSELEKLTQFCSDYLRQESADGSDAGLCIASADQVDSDVQQYGRRAKSEVFTQKDSRGLASRKGFYLEGLTGDEGGVIGALAAVGLRAEGNDGRYIGLRGVRELEVKDYTVGQLKAMTDIDQIKTTDGFEVTGLHHTVSITEWARPVLLNGNAVLLVEKANDDTNDQWRVVPKTVIKTY
ncbi:hypothetical protein GO003_014520 [Methylicorpusculum oleiharenae]|uniref:ABC transporter substrate-binding protein n=1 Tax=Methylicorpusculum oleiharenae TaxID=1338687 RepID=UPI001359FB9E|nr:ABC transporter substrate-binding protein [Methylicorpusculum oleiharenae]MCD2451606.1 hypothetical protein [Methylicorpusculum oleiharenae]